MPNGPATQRFQGFTLGPGHYGKSFLHVAPPTREVRQAISAMPPTRRATGGSALLFCRAAAPVKIPHDNSMFWDIYGRWASAETRAAPRAISSTTTNVLQWLKRGPPRHSPPSLRSGRVVYYDAIPDTNSGRRGPPAWSRAAPRRNSGSGKTTSTFVIGAGKYIDGLRSVWRQFRQRQRTGRGEPLLQTVLQLRI